MPRNQDSIKIGPVSGKISPSATLNPQAKGQIYRVYNTGKIACPVLSGSVSEGCSQDFGVNAATTVFLGAPSDATPAPDIEAVYELLSTIGVRSGKFSKPGASNKTILSNLGSSAFYRIFNTQKNGTISIAVGISAAVIIAKGSSRDFFVPGNVAVTVDKNDRGVYEFLAFAETGAKVNTSARSGHFQGTQTIASLMGNPQYKTVYRISNSSDRDINYTGMPMMPSNVQVKPGCSCDVEVAIGGSLVLTNGSGTGEIAGSYELLLINQ